MTGTLTLDTVQDSRVEIGPGSIKRIERGFQVDNIDTTGLNPYDLLPEVLTLTGMPEMSDPHPSASHSDAILSNVVVVGLLPNALRGVLVYSTPGYATVSAYIITRSTRLVQHTENILPNGVILEAGFEIVVHHPSTPEQIAAGNPDGTDETVKQVDYTPITARRPVTQLIAEGIRFGVPDDSAADYVGFVNQNAYKGRPAGSWMIEDHTTGYSKFGGYHNFRVATTGNILGRYHSTFVPLYNSTVGKYIKINRADVLASLAQPYVYDIINRPAPGEVPLKGFSHIGPYPLVDFATIGLTL